METRNNKHTSRGRPPSLHKKDYRLALRLSSAEYLVINEKAKEAGLKVSSYLRKAALYVTIHSGTTTEQMQVIRQLAGMSNNLNQIAKLCHQQGILSGLSYFEKYRNALDEILKKLKPP